MKKIILFICLLLVFVLVGCSSQTPTTEPPQSTDEEVAAPATEVSPTEPETQPTNTETLPTDAPDPTATDAPPTATSEPPTPEPLPIFPAAPHRIEFQSDDGRMLVGTYYPASVNPAPIVILMHEGLAERSQMEPLALWLQNRPDELPTGPTGQSAYDWMPSFPAEIGSVAVFAFDLRGHGESEGPMPSDGQEIDYSMDIRAAIAQAKTFEGVISEQVLSIGASMFADAALNGCITLDGTAILPEQPGNGCVGVLSLSPFAFSGVPYDQAADAFLGTLSQPIVWCLHSTDDYQPETCAAIDGKERARAEIYPGGIHGVSLLQPGLDPDVGQVFVDFLLLSLAQ